MDHSQPMDNVSSIISSKLQEQPSQLKNNECSEQKHDNLNKEGLDNFEEQQATCSSSEHSQVIHKRCEGVHTPGNCDQNIAECALVISKDADIFNDCPNVEEGSKFPVYNNQIFNRFTESQALMPIEAETDSPGGISPTNSSIPNYIRQAVKDTSEKPNSESDLSDFEDLKCRKRRTNKSIIDMELPSSGEIRETFELLNFNYTLRKSSSSSDNMSKSEDEPVVNRLPTKHKRERRASESVEFINSWKSPKRILTRNRYGNSGQIGNDHEIISKIIVENIEKMIRHKTQKDANLNDVNRKNKNNLGEDKKKHNLDSVTTDKGRRKVNKMNSLSKSVKLKHDGRILRTSNTSRNKSLPQDNLSVSTIATRSKQQLCPSSVQRVKKHSLDASRKKLSNTFIKTTRPKKKIADKPTTNQTRTSTKVIQNMRTRRTLPSTTRHQSLKKKKTASITPKIREGKTEGSIKSPKVSSKRSVNMQMRRNITDTAISKTVTRSTIGNKDSTKTTRRRFLRVSQKGKTSITSVKNKTGVLTASNSNDTNEGPTVKTLKRTSGRLANLLGKRQSPLFAQVRRTAVKNTTNPYKLKKNNGTSDISKRKVKTKRRMLLREKKKDIIRIRKIINLKSSRSRADTNTLQYKTKTSTPSETKKKHIDLVKEKIKRKRQAKYYNLRAVPNKTEMVTRSKRSI